MTVLPLRRFSLGPALALALVLSGCVGQPRTLDTITNPPIPPTYDWKKNIADWMKSAFVEPASLRSVMISDPVATEAPSANWLVCLELDARARNGDYMGPRRFALGVLTTEYKDPTGKITTVAALVTPDSSGRLSAIECDKQPLRWTAWPNWQQSSAPPSPKKPSAPRLGSGRS